MGKIQTNFVLNKNQFFIYKTAPVRLPIEVQIKIVNGSIMQKTNFVWNNLFQYLNIKSTIHKIMTILILHDADLKQTMIKQIDSAN